MTIRYTRVRGKGQRRFRVKPRAGDTTSKPKVVLNVRKGDEVMVIRGDDKGKTGKVLRTIPDKRQVVVQNINYVWRHLKRSQQNPQGGRIQKEAPLPISNVMVVCSETGKPTRVYRDREQKGQRMSHRSDKPVNAVK